jgi:hypothetical protein
MALNGGKPETAIVMTEHDLRAIYEYLKAVPRNPGPQGIPDAPYLQNVCE